MRNPVEVVAKSLEDVESKDIGMQCNYCTDEVFAVWFSDEKYRIKMVDHLLEKHGDQFGELP